ncbi:hypothetical protein [Microbispora sp. H13382]|uniref:hypothetical protein n=1 Tax=Microbispora sp. H13382 TaxID=2729112 RepID=UPI001602E901|nr:hypothetical protein [Microbispora sp. H13382]
MRPGLATAAAALLAPARALLLPACVLLLSACAPPDADRGFTPGGGAEPAAATAPGTPARPPGTEAITAASGLTVEIEWPDEPDPVRSAVIKAFARDFTAQWRAVGTSGGDRSYVKGIDAESSAYQDAVTWVRGFLDDRQSARGVAKLYALRVPALMGRGAEAYGCVDLTGVRLTDQEGTALARQPAWLKRPRAVYLQTAGLGRGDDGVWRIRLYRHADYPDELAKECQR